MNSLGNELSDDDADDNVTLLQLKERVKVMPQRPQVQVRNQKQMTKANAKNNSRLNNKAKKDKGGSGGRGGARAGGGRGTSKGGRGGPLISTRAPRATKANLPGRGSNVPPIPDFGKSTKIEKTGKIGKV